MSDTLAPAFDRLLAGCNPPAELRRIEAGGSAATVWTALVDSGFLDALVPEAHGGAGLTLAEAFPLFLAEGHHAVPLPFGPTVLVRAVLAGEGAARPHGPITIAPVTRRGGEGSITCPGAPYGLQAEWVAAALPEGWVLLPVAAAQRVASGVHGSLRADLHWATLPAQARVSAGRVAWGEAGAALTAARLAGAMARVLAMTVDFANQREQFGRSIGKFQAVQHLLAVLAEHVAASRIAAEIGCSGAGPCPVPLRAALAKARTSEAAALAAATAHAVHGAIGVTAEFDLHLLTRRLHEGRADFGAETHWNRVLGRALLAEPTLSTLDFMRHALIPPPEDLAR